MRGSEVLVGEAPSAFVSADDESGSKVYKVAKQFYDFSVPWNIRNGKNRLFAGSLSLFTLLVPAFANHCRKTRKHRTSLKSESINKHRNHFSQQRSAFADCSKTHIRRPNPPPFMAPVAPAQSILRYLLHIPLLPQ